MKTKLLAILALLALAAGSTYAAQKVNASSSPKAGVCCGQCDEGTTTSCPCGFGR